jgi:amidohydrolase
MLENKDLKKLVDFRKTLHSRPELSGFERDTADLICNYLNPFSPSKIKKDIGGHGVAVTFNLDKKGPHLLFRADLDALPIFENNQFEHKSSVDGVFHGCGHDGHMASLCGVAHILSNYKNRGGAVTLFFQPEEETGAGALKSIEDEYFKSLGVDYIFGWHNLPGFSEGALIVKDGIFAISSVGIKISMEGRTSHAGEPEKGLSPMNTLIKLVEFTNSFKDPGIDYFLITPTYLNVGTVGHGSSPGIGELLLTVRATNSADLFSITDQIIEFAEIEGGQNNLKVLVEKREFFPEVNNDENLLKSLREIASSSNIQVVERSEPFRWTEDFGNFTKEYRSLFWGIGAGEDYPPLHDKNFDFNDNLISKSAIIIDKILDKYLSL